MFLFIASKTALYPNPDWGLFFVHVLFVSALIVCSFIDMDLRIIPDEIDKPGIILGPALSLMVPQMFSKSDLISLPFAHSFFQSIYTRSFFTSVAGVVCGAGIIFLLQIVGKAIFKKDAMGDGDVKYMGMIGGFLGYKAVIISFLISCFLGAIFGTLKKLFSKDSYIPFGPYLSAGALSVLYYKPQILRFLLEDYPRWLKGFGTSF
jgi:leader peptidase (prepilin peptidase)/N-methyltransferase